jgi:hypothetical protein
MGGGHGRSWSSIAAHGELVRQGQEGEGERGRGARHGEGEGYRRGAVGEGARPCCCYALSTAIREKGGGRRKLKKKEKEKEKEKKRKKDGKFYKLENFRKIKDNL